MSQQYTGSKFFAEILGIDMEQITAAFSFYSGYKNDNLVRPDSWAIYSNTGILNNTGVFYNNSGSGTFNGNTYMKLSGSNLLEDSIIYISYEKVRTGDEILLSSVEKNNFQNYSGFCLGINDANKLYFKYWNPVEGAFSFTYTGILANKNIIFLNKNASIVTLGHFNNNERIVETQDFEIFQNAFVEGGNITLGGQSNYIEWINDTATNFSGYIDKFFLYQNTNSIYKNILVSGLFANPTGYNGSYVTNCYMTGGFVNSGFSYTGVTGVGFIPVISGITGITGYATGFSGYSYSGITGYSNLYIGSYIDNCGNSDDIFNTIALSGLITGKVSINIPQTGIQYFTGFIESQLTGTITGSSLVEVSGEFCDTFFEPSGGVNYQIDTNFLSSLSYNEVSLLSEVIKENDIIELFYSNYEPKFLEYNRNLIFDALNENYFYIDREFNKNEIILFANGQALIDSGYNLINSGYETLKKPNLDYFITGNTVETNKFYAFQDDLFYDYFTGNFYAFEISGTYSSGYILNNPTNSNNVFVYLNGQKLINNVNYELISSGSSFDLIKINKAITGNNFIIIKQYNSFEYVSGNSGTIPILSNINHDCSQVYLNGIKQKLFSNYIENSNYDLLSGTYIENQLENIIYNDTEDFFINSSELNFYLSSSSSSLVSASSSSSSFIYASSSSSLNNDLSSSSSSNIVESSSSSSLIEFYSSSSSYLGGLSPSSSSSQFIINLSSSSSTFINASLSSSSSSSARNSSSSSSSSSARNSSSSSSSQVVFNVNSSSSSSSQVIFNTNSSSSSSSSSARNSSSSSSSSSARNSSSSSSSSSARNSSSSSSSQILVDSSSSSSNILVMPSSSSSSSILILGICNNLSVQSSNIIYSGFGGLYSGEMPFNNLYQDGINFKTNSNGRIYFKISNNNSAINGDTTYIRLQESTWVNNYWTPIESGTLNGPGSISGNIYVSSGQNLLFGYEREGSSFPLGVVAKLDYLYLICSGTTGELPIPIYIKYLSNYE